MIDAAFFIRWQRVILWLANTWAGRLYLTSSWNRSQRRMTWRWIDAPHFTQITPSAFTFAIGDGRFVSRCYSGNHFAEKVAAVLFWMPYEAAHVQPAFAYGVVALLAALVGVPWVAGTVTTFNPSAGNVDPLDGAVVNGGDSTEGNWGYWRNGSGGYGVSATETSTDIQANLDFSGTLYRCKRLFFAFNTGGILPATASIYGGPNTKLSLRTATFAQSLDSTYATVVQAFQDDDAVLQGGDYRFITPAPVSAGVPHTEGVNSGDRFALASYTNDTTVMFRLNSVGVSWIARSGESKPVNIPTLPPNRTRLGLVSLFDLLDVSPTGHNSADFIMADNGSNKPELSVEWNPAGGFPFDHLRAGSGVSVSEQRRKS